MLTLHFYIVRFIAEMDAANTSLVDAHADGHGQPPPDPPTNSPTLEPAERHEGGQFQGFQPYGPSTTAASPYYAPSSGFGYGGGYDQPSAPVPQQQQQQQQLTVVAANQLPIVYVEDGIIDSYTIPMIYSCFIFWCCNPVSGLIGFIMASKYAIITRSQTPVLCQNGRTDTACFGTEASLPVAWCVRKELGYLKK